MEKKSFQRRVPESYCGIQVNACKTPTCEAFGVDPLEKTESNSNLHQIQEKSQKNHPLYKVISSGRHKRSLLCKKCMERKQNGEFVTASSTMLSNEGVIEEFNRLRSYLMPPTILCPNKGCGSRESSIKKNGLTAKGTQRYKCTKCKTSFTVGIETRKQKRPEINKSLFKLLVSGMALKRIAFVLNVDTRTVYNKINFLHKQCTDFISQREQCLLNGSKRFDRLYLATDGQTLVCNWTNRRDKRNVEFYALGTACLNSGYIFAYNCNYDSTVLQSDIDLKSSKVNDSDVANCYRKYARYWTDADYSTTCKNNTQENNKENLEHYDESTKLPNNGSLIHHEYTMHGHFLLLKSLTHHCDKVRFYLDRDQGLDKALLAVFSNEIKNHKCDGFVISCDKSKNTNELRQLRNDSNHIIKNETGRNRSELSAEEFNEAVNNMLIKNIANPIYKGNPKKPWVAYPILDKTEINKQINAITDISKLDLTHQANLYRKASLHAIDRYFMQIRRSLRMFERPFGSSANQRRLWYGYAPYNPDMFRKLGDIYRVYYNYVLKGADGQTPAMRLGLAKGPVDLNTIIYLGKY